MIEQLLNTIVSELGPTGVLVAGLYFLLLKPLQKMCLHIETINHETGEIRDAILALKSSLDKWIQNENRR